MYLFIHLFIYSRNQLSLVSISDIVGRSTLIPWNGQHKYVKSNSPKTVCVFDAAKIRIKTLSIAGEYWLMMFIYIVHFIDWIVNTIDIAIVPPNYSDLSHSHSECRFTELCCAVLYALSIWHGTHWLYAPLRNVDGRLFGRHIPYSHCTTGAYAS